MMNLEEKQTVKGLKFGIVYVKEGQTKEDELFSNGMCEFKQKNNNQNKKKHKLFFLFFFFFFFKN